MKKQKGRYKKTGGRSYPAVAAVFVIALLGVLLGLTYMQSRDTQQAYAQLKEEYETLQETYDTTQEAYTAAQETLQQELIGDLAPVQAVMEACGYTDMGGHTYQGESGGLTVEITFDFEAGVGRKSGYAFELTEYAYDGAQYYAALDDLAAMTNFRLDYDETQVTATPVSYAAHEWTTAFSPLIAYAGGAIRVDGNGYNYANSLEALVQNYELGHRVFEFDFLFTTDGNLAAVHDGQVSGNESEIAFSAEEFKVHTDGRYYTNLLIDDILDQMLINRDMFLVTDTKMSTDRQLEAFEVIVEAAMARDPELLDRIVPQIYNIPMYDLVMEAYDFQSVIFTLYATTETNENVVEFSAEKENIHVITTWGDGRDDRLEEGLADLAAAHGLLVYAHTLNAYKDIIDLKAKGVYGVYTDYLLPRDFALYFETGGE